MATMPEELVETILLCLYNDEATFGTLQATLFICRQWFRIGYHLLQQRRLLITQDVRGLYVPQQVEPLKVIGIMFLRRSYNLEFLVSKSAHALGAIQQLTLDISCATWPLTTARQTHSGIHNLYEHGRSYIMSETHPLRMAFKHMTYLQTLTLRLRETERYQAPPQLVILLLHELEDSVRSVEIDVVAVRAGAATWNERVVMDWPVKRRLDGDERDRIHDARRRFRRCGRYDFGSIRVRWFGFDLI